MKKEKQKTDKKERKLDMHNLKCACNGGKCEGSCREAHLDRKRDWSNPVDTCPEAFNERKPNAKR